MPHRKVFNNNDMCKLQRKLLTTCLLTDINWLWKKCELTHVLSCGHHSMMCPIMWSGNRSPSLMWAAPTSLMWGVHIGSCQIGDWAPVNTLWSIKLPGMPEHWVWAEQVHVHPAPGASRTILYSQPCRWFGKLPIKIGKLPCASPRHRAGVMKTRRPDPSGTRQYIDYVPL